MWLDDTQILKDGEFILRGLIILDFARHRLDRNANMDQFLSRNHDNKLLTLLLVVVVDSTAAADLQLAVAE